MQSASTFSAELTALTVAQTIARALKAAGVERIYGLPGGEMLDLLEATRQVGIRFVLTHHEAAAALMAAAEGQYRRSPAACISTLGPGATNLVTGVAHAYLDRSPMIVLTADLPTTLGADYTHQRLDLKRLYEPITKASYVITAETVAVTVERAIRLAWTEPFGPVSLHVPRDMNPLQAATPGTPSSEPLQGLGDLSLQQVADRLNRAKQPLVIVGLGTPPRLSDPVRRLIEAYRAPFGVTPKVKGIVDEQHPLFSGTYGGMMAEAVLYQAVRDSDLIVCVGVEPSELDRYWLDHPNVVWLLTSPGIGQPGLPRNAWCGDLGEGLGQLRRLLEPAEFEGENRAAKVRKTVRAKLESGVPVRPQGLSPLRTLQALAKAWPASDAVCCDVGAHKLLIGQAWPASAPNRFFMSNGLSTMGFGIAAPIALSLTEGGAPVLSVVGDGGLLMYMGELETAVREGARVLYAVFIDSAYSLIESSQRRRGLPQFGMRFRPPDLSQIGAAFGVPVWFAENERELAAGVRAFQGAGSTALLGVQIDPTEYDEQVRG